MIVDLILDRKDGEPYNAHDFYVNVMGYEAIFGMDFSISRALDIGTNKDREGKLVGDIDFNSVKDIAEYITPVPGGIGPMTIVCLFDNLIKVYRKNV